MSLRTCSTKGRQSMAQNSDGWKMGKSGIIWTGRKTWILGRGEQQWGIPQDDCFWHPCLPSACPGVSNPTRPRTHSIYPQGRNKGGRGGFHLHPHFPSLPGVWVNAPLPWQLGLDVSSIPRLSWFSSQVAMTELILDLCQDLPESMEEHGDEAGPSLTAVCWCAGGGLELACISGESIVKPSGA